MGIGLGSGSDSLGKKDCDSGGRKCCWGGGSGFVPAVEAAGCAVESVAAEAALGSWAGCGLEEEAVSEAASCSVASAQESF